MLVEVSIPSGFETSRLDDGRLDVPQWRKLFVQGFGEPFQGFCEQEDEL